MARTRKADQEIQEPTGQPAQPGCQPIEKRHNTAALLAQIETLELQMQGHKAQRTNLPMHILAADLDNDDKLDMIPSKQRLLLDIIRMIAYRAETHMILAVAQMQAKKTNARKLLSAVMTSDADILPDSDNAVLRVRLFGLGSDSCDRALNSLIDELNETQTIFPGTNMRIVYEIPNFAA